ncbi:MAG TPA: carbohydrate ABC transporter substrate-binding protein [Anaerolineae bacterium]|nr:carbohydrate ABC transporter substrate-binding protein [Anaerolineae bacterium]
MSATNQKNLEDSTFAKITNADLIEPGWKLWVPSTEEAEAFLATYDPSKPELLFGKGAAGQLVIASWWTAGGEAEGLTGLFDIYASKYPDVEIVNATVAGGAGFVFRPVLKTRLIAGDPPDTFQLHAGLEVEGYDPETYLEPLDDIYASEGLEEAFPADLLTLLKYKGHYWGVPVNIHRSNILWYDKSIFADAGLTPPETWDDFFAVCEALKAKGIVPFVMGTSGGWEAPHAFEDVLAGTCGAETYKGLWAGTVPWTDSCVTQALETFKKILTYVNTDHPALSWDGAGHYLIDNKGAMMFMGDWTNGWFQAEGYTDYGWAPPPGTKGIFVALSDSFALPKKAPNRDNAIAWVKVCGSKEGQEAFNPKKGSICARTDCDPALFNEYLQSAMADWAVDAIVPSVVHGAAAIESWVTDYKDAITLFVTSGDVAGTQAALQQACVDAGACQ